MSEDVSTERLSVAEAAAALGVTRDAVHKRIKRDSIKHDKGEDGRFYVYVDTSTAGLDTSVDESKDESKVEVLERLIEGQQERIEFLERSLERRDDETERLHRIIAGLAQANTNLSARVPELEAPTEAPESPAPTDTPNDPPANAHAATEAPATANPRPWWRRVFGG